MLISLRSGGQNAAGFTLLEILIALSIFLVIALIMSGALYMVLGARQVLNQHNVTLAKLQYNMTLVMQDIEQVVPYPIPKHTSRPVYLLGTQHSLEFMRGGNVNPLGHFARSSLINVHYTFAKHQFYRSLKPQGVQVRARYQQLLSLDFSNVWFTFLDKQGRRQSKWPPAKNASQSLPEAIVIHYVNQNGAEYSQWLVLPH